MKWIIGLLIVSVLGLTTAAPNYGRYPTDVQEFVDALESAQAMVDGSVETLSEEADAQQVPVNEILKIVQAVPVDKILKVVIPIALDLGKAGYKVTSRLVKYLINCGICKKCSKSDERDQILSQYYTDASGRDETLMAMMEAMDNMNAMDEKLSEAQVNLMKDNLIAEAEFLSKISGAIKKAIKKVKKAAKFVKKVAKNVLCEN